jgi:hypothetical protein
MKIRAKRAVIAVPLLFLLSACQEELLCPPGQSDCGGRCVSLSDDEANCGACGATVPAPLELCRQGAAACVQGVATCDGACTDLERDPAHCGSCGNACAEGELCSTAGEGTCVTACAEGYERCGDSCVVLESDRFHCGACGNACAPGEACRGGHCRAAVFAACINTNEVAPLSLDLDSAGEPWDVTAGPTALALRGDVLYSANGWPAASLAILPLDRTIPTSEIALPGSDLQNVLVHGDALLVSNGEKGTVAVLSPAGAVLDEIPLGPQEGANPHGIAISGTSAYVALYKAQKIAKLDVSGLAACAAPDPTPPACGEGGTCDAGRTCVSGTCRLVCATVAGEIDLAAIEGSASPDHFPTPSDVVAAAGRIFVGLSNLADDPSDAWNFWVIPSPPANLAVIDPADDSVTLLDLGPECVKPGPLALRGSTLWVGCGSLSFPDVAPGVLVPVDLSGGVPSVGSAIQVGPVVPGALAFCAGLGYVADQASGAVLTFDPDAGTTIATTTVCSDGQWGTAVADIACAD